MKLSPRNLARDAISAPPTAAAGYSGEALRDGIMSIPYRGPSGASLNITWDWSSEITPDVVAILGMRSVTPGVEITTVQLERWSNFWIIVANLTPDERDDWIWEQGVIGLSGSSWRIRISLSAAGQVEIGETWFGEWTDLPIAAELTRRHTWGVMVNGDFAREIEPVRRSYDLAIPPLVRDDADALVSTISEIGGASDPVLVRTAPGAVGEIVLGRFGNELSGTVRPHLLHQGIGLTFTEGRRPHGR